MQNRSEIIARVNKLLDSRAGEFLAAMVDGLWQKMEPVIEGETRPIEDASPGAAAGK